MELIWFLHETLLLIVNYCPSLSVLDSTCHRDCALGCTRSMFVRRRAGVMASMTFIHRLDVQDSQFPLFDVLGIPVQA